MEQEAEGKWSQELSVFAKRNLAWTHGGGGQDTCCPGSLVLGPWGYPTLPQDVQVHIKPVQDPRGAGGEESWARGEDW